MKRLTLLVLVCGLASLGLSGCHEPPPKPKPIKAAKVKPAPKPKVVKAKPVKSVKPGTVAQLDSENGFRDAVFGSAPDNISNLVSVGTDEARQIKTYRRTDENLQLDTVHLETIEYAFFENRLFQVTAKWKVEYPDSPERSPQPTDLSPLFTTLYGHPTRHSVNKDVYLSAWHGKQAAITLTETLLPGVPDVVKGGWAIPPTAEGEIIFYSVPIYRDAEAQTVNHAANTAGSQ